MTVINTNIKALFTQGALKVSQRESKIAMEQLSTGKRINSAKDDAAGLAIAARMTQNIQSLNQSVRNAGDAITLIQTAEGATNDITSMLQRMSEMAVQASNDTYSPEQRGYLDEEFQQLKQEIVRITETHEWNGFPILNGKAGEPAGFPSLITQPRPVSTGLELPLQLTTGDLNFVGSDGTETTILDDDLHDEVSFESNYSDPKASAIALAAAINKKTKDSGVSATANPASITANNTSIDPYRDIQTDLYINGVKVSLSLRKDQTPEQRRQYVVDSINVQTNGALGHGTVAADNGSGGITLSTKDGRNLSVWYNEEVATGADFGLGTDATNGGNPPGVTGVLASGPDLAGFMDAATVYGSIKLSSKTSFTVQPGENALDGDPAQNFAAFTKLGFVAGPVVMQNIGRLSFQVGPSADQLISIDLADFGKNGPITGEITSDTAPKSIGTVQGANDVIRAVNHCLDQVADVRATMGAVMNRLQYVVDNLTNVAMNEEASRSQIEDADYASASTELARTQIMQQAATAVLAQANTDMQTVMKLLQ
jgi:flagellin